MKKHLLLVLVCVSFLITPCTNASEPDHDKARAAIKAVLDEQAEGWNEGDIEKYMAGYDNSDSLRFASGGSVQYGWEATFERYKKRYPDKAAMGSLEFSNLDITIISDDTALVFGQWKLKREKDEPWGLFTLLVKETANGWRIVHDHTSSGDK